MFMFHRCPPWASLLAACVVASCSSPSRPGRGEGRPAGGARNVARDQIPTWSADDLQFFTHGSMCTEVIPERVLTAFRATYPDLFPGDGFSAFGLIPDERYGLPIGFSRRPLAHLGGQSAIGINCASCHLGKVLPAAEAPGVLVLGMTSHFDVQAFFGAAVVAMLRTAEPANMERFLPHYLAACDPEADAAARRRLAAELKRQDGAITAALADDPAGSKGVAPGDYHRISEADLTLDRERLRAEQVDLASLARALLRLFHNVRTALRIPDRLPDKPPPLSGPGRNDAFGVLAMGLLGIKTIDAPAKYGDVWNMSERAWNHWDANNSNGTTRNVMAVIGLGAAVVDKRAVVDFPPLARHAALVDRIRPPRYPFAVDDKAAARGATHYAAHCARCHDGPQDDRRLYSPDEIGTDPQRVRQWDATQAERYHNFPDGAFEIPGYRPPKEPPFRVTGKYWAAAAAGMWARSPYLHNGSVRTMRELLTSPASRPKSFRRGSRVYDAAAMGYTDEGFFVFDAAGVGNGNGGHDYGTGLSDAEKRELIEYLKTR